MGARTYPDHIRRVGGVQADLPAGLYPPPVAAGRIGPSGLRGGGHGAGYAGPAVVGGKVYYADRVRKDPGPDTPKGTLPGTERVVCLSLAKG